MSRPGTAQIEAAVRADPARGVEVLIDSAIHAANGKPLVGVAMSEEGLALLRSMSIPEREALLRRDERLVDRVLTVLAEAGVELDVSRSLLVGLLRSLVFLGWHRAEIGDDLTDEVAAWLAPTLRGALLPGASRDRGDHGPGPDSACSETFGRSTRST